MKKQEGGGGGGLATTVNNNATYLSEETINFLYGTVHTIKREKEAF